MRQYAEKGRRAARRAARMFVLAAIALPAGLAFTGSASAATLQVETTGTDNPGCVTPCATINYAIGQAAAGDTVSVGPGTFTETTGVGITKPLTLRGTSIPGSKTTISGGNSITAVSPGGTIRINSIAGNVTVQDFTVVDFASVGTPSILTGNKSGLYVRPPLSGGSYTYTFKRLHLDGSSGGPAVGVRFRNYTAGSTANISFSGGTVCGQSGNGILVENSVRELIVRNSVLCKGGGSYYAYYNLQGDITNGLDNPENAQQVLSGNTIIGGGIVFAGDVVPASDKAPGFNQPVIRDNSILLGAAPSPEAISLFTGPNVTYTRGAINEAEISGNVITSSDPASVGIRMTGLVRDPMIFDNISQGTNTFLDTNRIAGITPVPFVEPSGIRMWRNRIDGANDTSAVNNNTPQPIDAYQNWWGCEQGPNYTDNGNPSPPDRPGILPECAGINQLMAGGDVLFDPWLTD